MSRPSNDKPAAIPNAADADSIWQLRDHVLTLGPVPRLMGILNVTPDSFSDGGRFNQLDLALQQADELIDGGADIIDVGGESTRPYSTPVSAEDELQRVIPVIEALTARCHVPISIDTSKALVAQAAMDAGAQIINDVTGLAGDPHMPQVAQTTQAGVCVMHMRGTPQDMQDDPQYANVVDEIIEYLDSRRQMLIEQGIDASRICLDPGIGFGKTHQHNLELLAQIGRFRLLQAPLLVGHSRKGFLAKLLGDKERDRDAATAGVAVHLACQGVDVIRVHNVRLVRDAILGFQAAGGAAEFTLTP